MAAERSLVFYSWQSDLPNKTNRSFIEDALEKAAKAIRDDDSIQVEPVIDRDTVGVAGSPEISKTIFSKIDQAKVFVCDISIINSGADARLAPNPNVLIELGYALKALGENRIIMVLNDVYGIPEVLPFDLRMRRVTRYHKPKEVDSRTTQPRDMANMLKDALYIILNELDILLPGEMIQPVSTAEQARIAIKESRPDQAAKIEEMTPDFTDQEPDEQLIQAIGKSTEMVIEFASLAQTIAQMPAAKAAQAMYKGFGSILNLYTFPPDFRGTHHEFDHDLAKFLGHELFVTFYSFLIEDEQWELIADLLDQDLFARGYDFEQHSVAVPFSQISQYSRLLEQIRKQRLGSGRWSHYADLLNERHTQGELAKLVPIEQFAEADYFLFLRTELQPATQPTTIVWIPWSALYLKQPPRYILGAERIKCAQQLLRPLGIEDIDTLRARLRERAGKLAGTWGDGGRWHYPLSGFHFTTIGSRQ
jgi:hypothetical protein